jgi:rubrerythrin
MRDRSRQASSDHRCGRCGYQIATAAPFPRCPMCGTKDWKQVVRVPQGDPELALM